MRLPGSVRAVLAAIAGSMMIPSHAAVSDRSPGAEAPADLLFTGGAIRTQDPARPVAEALAVRGERIVFVGSAREAERLRGSGTRVVDLAGGALYPGFIDSHGHVAGLGKTLRTVSLLGTRSAAEAAERVRAAAARVRAAAAEREDSGWLEGRGWDQNDWPDKSYPTWRDLEGATARPAALRRVDGHAVWVNRAALEACGVTAATPDVAGGKILRFAGGSPTGVFIDNAMDLVTKRIPAADEAEILARLRAAMAALAAAGVTGAMDAGVNARGIAAYRALGAEHGFRARVDVFLADEESLLEEWWARGPEIGSCGGFFSVRGVKLYADGALGSRGAALLADYADEPGNRGLLVTDPARLLAVTGRSLAGGFAVGIHAIGDRGNRVALDTFEAALRERAAERGAAGATATGTGARSPDRPFCRLEHAQVLAPEELPRLGALGVVASIQPTHATSDMGWAEARLGPERMRGAYAMRSLLAGGARVVLGSDFPVESCEPLRGIHAAVTRQDEQGDPPGGWHPEERLTAEEAVRGFTAEAAWALGAASDRGTLAVGKLADLVALSRDLSSVAPGEILKTRVLLTVVGGRVVFEAGKL